MEVQSEMVQPGWAVYAADGDELGTVLGVEQDVLRIKHPGLLGDKEWRVPRSAVVGVETGRVELSLSSKEVKESN